MEENECKEIIKILKTTLWGEVTVKIENGKPVLVSVLRKIKLSK